RRARSRLTLSPYTTLFRSRPADSVSSQPLRALGYSDDAWEEQRRLHLAELTELFGSPTPPARIDGAAAVLVCGVVIQADSSVSSDRKSTRLNSSHVSISYA